MSAEYIEYWVSIVSGTVGYTVCNENFGPPSKIGPPGLILVAKSGPPLPISVPPVKLQLVTKLDLDHYSEP